MPGPVCLPKWQFGDGPQIQIVPYWAQIFARIGANLRTKVAFGAKLDPISYRHVRPLRC